MARRCPTAKVIGKGEIKDHELLFRGHSMSAVATVEPKAGSSVPVLIWEIGFSYYIHDFSAVEESNLCLCISYVDY